MSRHAIARGLDGRLELSCNVCPEAAEVYLLPMTLALVGKVSAEFNARHAHPELTCDGRLEWHQIAGMLLSREVEGGGHVIDGRCPKCGWAGTASPKKPRARCGRELEEDAGEVRRLTCCCCGESTFGRQWWNRDTGFGLCNGCIVKNGVAGVALGVEARLFGIRGVHWDLRSVAKAEGAAR